MTTETGWRGRAVRAGAWMLLGAALVGVGAIGAGCGGATSGSGMTETSPSYCAALAATAPAHPPALVPGSPEERVALNRIVALYTDYSRTNVSARAHAVYAADAYLRDGFKELHGGDAIAAYLVHGTESLRHGTFEFADQMSHDGEYYLRWIMVTNLKRDKPDRVSRVLGITHFRFNAAGQVIFQQEYWDPSDVLYSRIPIAGWMINKVKKDL